jgi:8-oxo-dGTP pyrophosphatase MutT (NUDIX family)
MRQTAAFPYRLVEGPNGSSGSIELLLVTTGSGRWIIPKGDVDLGMAPHLAAEKEAFEEGGVRGRISATSIGSFRHRKNQNGASIPTQVDVYPLEVWEKLEHWPEDDHRDRCWLPLHEAANKVELPELGAIISRFRP